MRKDDSFTLGTRYFFLACDEELRRLQADTSSAEDFLRLERNRKPRMKSLWHPGYDSFGTIPFFFLLSSVKYSGPSISDPFSDL